MSKERMYSNQHDVEDFLDYIPETSEKCRINKFIESLEGLEPDKALARVNRYVKFWIKKGVLAKQNQEEFSKMIEDYDEEYGDGSFLENYKTGKFVGEGYDFIEGGDGPYFKVAALKISDKFDVPETNDKELFKSLFLGAIQILLQDFYFRYENKIRKTIENSDE